MRFFGKEEFSTIYYPWYSDQSVSSLWTESGLQIMGLEWYNSHKY